MTDDEKRIELLTKWNAQKEETIKNLQERLKREEEYSCTLKKENEQLRKEGQQIRMLNKVDASTFLLIGLTIGLSVATLLNILMR